MLFFSNHLVGTEILFYACQNVISLAFFTDIPKEGETHCVFGRLQVCLQIWFKIDFFVT